MTELRNSNAVEVDELLKLLPKFTALGEAQSQFKVAYDQRIAEFKEQLSIARAAFELELSVMIEDFYQALQAALTRRAQVSPKHPEITAVASQEEEEDFPAPPQKRKKKVIAE